MAMSKVMRIVKSMPNSACVFNDRLVTGTRSIKVWGWGMPEYERAADALMQAGFQVKIVTFQRKGRWYPTVRLHVQPF